MKQILVLGLLLSCSQVYLSAMEEEKRAQKLSFTNANPGEDLSVYQDLMLKVYLAFATGPINKEEIEKVSLAAFKVLTSWIGQPGRLFVKVKDGETPVGFTTLESLDTPKDTRIAFHLSPLLPEYQQQYPIYFKCVQDEFPDAKSVYASCTEKADKLLALLKREGFVRDDSYVPNKELIPDPKGFIGYRKDFIN